MWRGGEGRGGEGRHNLAHTHLLGGFIGDASVVTILGGADTERDLRERWCVREQGDEGAWRA